MLADAEDGSESSAQVLGPPPSPLSAEHGDPPLPELLLPALIAAGQRQRSQESRGRAALSDGTGQGGRRPAGRRPRSCHGNPRTAERPNGCLGSAGKPARGGGAGRAAGGWGSLICAAPQRGTGVDKDGFHPAVGPRTQVGLVLGGRCAAGAGCSPLSRPSVLLLWGEAVGEVGPAAGPGWEGCPGK